MPKLVGVEAGVFFGKRSLILLAIFAVAFLIAVYAMYILFVGSHISSLGNDWADFGSYYGGVAGVFISCLGFIVLLANLFRQEVQIRKISSDQSNAHAESVVIKLLDVLSNHVDGMEYRANGELRRGRAVFRYLYRNLARDFKQLVDGGSDVDSVETIEKAYLRFYRSKGSLVGHYFRTMYNIVKIVDRSCLDQESKEDVLSWLTCRLSRFELVLLFYNCLSSLGRNKFKPLIEKYHLLEHLEDRYIGSYAHLNMYSSSAFVDGL